MTHSPDEILAWPTDRLRAWIRTCPSDENLAWLAIAEGAAMEANSPTGGVLEARRTALGNLAVYAFRIAVGQNRKSRDGAVLSEIVLRSGLIHKLGAVPGTVQDTLPLWRLLETVLTEAEGLRNRIGGGHVDLANLSLDEILLLRRAKGALRCAELAFKTNEVIPPPLVDWWWKHRERLP